MKVQGKSKIVCFTGGQTTLLVALVVAASSLAVNANVHFKRGRRAARLVHNGCHAKVGVDLNLKLARAATVAVLLNALLGDAACRLAGNYEFHLKLAVAVRRFFHAHTRRQVHADTHRSSALAAALGVSTIALAFLSHVEKAVLLQVTWGCEISLSLLLSWFRLCALPVLGLFISDNCHFLFRTAQLTP